jgi:hypothetical protein
MKVTNIKTPSLYRLYYELGCRIRSHGTRIISKHSLNGVLYVLGYCFRIIGIRIMRYATTRVKHNGT